MMTKEKVEDAMKERQGSMPSLLKIVRGIVASKEWTVPAVNFIAGMNSVHQEAWNEAMEMKESK